MTWNIARLRDELAPLLGQRLTHRRIAGDSLILYFHGQPGAPNVCSIWLEPPWRYERDGKVIIGSIDIGRLSSYKTDEEKQAFHVACSFLHPILEGDLIDITVNDTSFDISMEFAGNHHIHVFANSGGDEEQWIYRNVPKHLALYVSPAGIVEHDN